MAVSPRPHYLTSPRRVTLGSEMPLTQKAIDELKEIHHRKTGEQLSDDEAWAMGHRLLRIFAILARPPARQPSEVRTASRLTDETDPT